MQKKKNPINPLVNKSNLLLFLNCFQQVPAAAQCYNLKES